MTNRRKRVIIQDVADYCGLSKSTVAYILREPDSCKATVATKEKVASAVRKLNYRPNPAAKALSTRRYHTIGVLMPPLGGYYSELMVHLDREMKARGFYGIFSFWEVNSSGTTNLNSFKHSITQLCNHGIDGIITPEYNNFLLELDVPVVIYGNQWPSFDCVYPDKVTYMKKTVEYLCSHGHHKIGFLGLTHEIRATVLREELLKRRLPVNEQWFINGVATPTCGENSMQELLSQDELPDAVILHSDFMMPGVLLAADNAGVRIPEDISVISFGNLLESKYFRPSLTTFDECLELGAKLLVEIMLRRINDPQMPQWQQSFEMPLVERKSVINRRI